MIPYLPKQISDKGIYLYLGSLAAVSLVFMRHAMSWEFMLIGVVWVVGFFFLSHSLTKKWQNLPVKKFCWSLFL